MNTFQLKSDNIDKDVPGVSGDLINDLDGELLVRPDVLAGLDRSISSLAEDFTGQMVQLLEINSNDERNQRQGSTDDWRKSGSVLD